MTPLRKVLLQFADAAVVLGPDGRKPPEMERLHTSLSHIQNSLRRSRQLTVSILSCVGILALTAMVLARDNSFAVIGGFAIFAATVAGCSVRLRKLEHEHALIRSLLAMIEVATPEVLQTLCLTLAKRVLAGGP